MSKRLVGLSFAIISLFMGSTSAQDSQDEAVVEATSFSGKPLIRPEIPEETLERLRRNLDHAQAELAEAPDDPERLIWVGRRLAYLWRYQDAIEVFTRGIEIAPNDARLYRHRGHRYITTRQLDKAIADFERAVELIEGQEDEVEPDGAPNAAGIPTSTLHTNIWYHLGLSYYLRGDFEKALGAYRSCLKASKNNDMRVATLDWLYMTLRRLGRHDEAQDAIQEIDPDLEIIENFSYHKRILMYRGLVSPESLLPSAEDGRSDLDLATQGYGVANWYLVEGQQDKAEQIMQQILNGKHWSAFGFIAAEADIARKE